MTTEELRASLRAHGYSEESTKTVVDFLGERVITQPKQHYTKPKPTRPTPTNADV